MPSSAAASRTRRRLNRNADGYADILWRNSATGANWMYLMNGNTITSSLLVNYVTGANSRIVR